MTTARPEVMRHAREDLTATVEGHFSPEDWELILDQAEAALAKATPPNSPEAWTEVVRSFYANQYWGYKANYRRPKPPKKKPNLGATFIIMAFNSMVLFKVGILWFGQLYSRSEEPKDAFIFYGLIALIVFNYVYFLYKHRNYVD